MHKRKYLSNGLETSAEKWDALVVGSTFSILDTTPCTIVGVEELTVTSRALRVTQEGRDERVIVMGMTRSNYNRTQFHLEDIVFI